MSKKKLIDRLKHWSLDRKICAGYGAAFVVAISGITAGFVLTQNTERKVLTLQAQAMEDVEAISNLKTGIIELMLHAQEMRAWEGGSAEAAIAAGFGDDFAHLVDDFERFQQDWQALRVLCEQHQHQVNHRLIGTTPEADLIDSLLIGHEAAVEAYIAEFSQLIQKIDPDNVQPDQVPSIQAELQALDQSPFISGLEDFLDQITSLSDATTAEQAEATVLLQQSVAFQRTIMLASILLSGLLGLILMRLTSRNLCRPLKEMTRRAQKSIREADLSLKMPITSNDEVGILATAFNNYSGFIANLVDSHRAVNEQLQATLAELNQAQLQMIQQEKMSSLGQLVAGVAHELNNPTTFIYSNLAHIQAYADQLLEILQLYQDGCEPDPAIAVKCQAMDLAFIRADLPKALASVEVGSERICEIVRSLQNFSRSDAQQAAVIDIHQGLNDTATILGHRLKAYSARPAIQLLEQYSPLPLVECYPGLLNQVFLNLLSNAIDAIEAQVKLDQQRYSALTPPQITIKTRLVESQWVEVEIQDNGSGIPPAVQSQIFNPFFTTKPIGEGTGLGLSLSYQIVAQRHGGELRCLSTGARGSTFVVKLPVRLPPRPAAHYPSSDGQSADLSAAAPARQPASLAFR